MGNELMTGSDVINPVFSTITMAFIKDTGWYDVDFDLAEKFMFGKNEGCDFLTQPCYENH